MDRYFENFQLVRYIDSIAINVMDRTAILNSVFGNEYAFYPYHVKDGMRAEVVAEKYYGDPDLVWLVYFSNNIVDPYHQWPMDESTFNSFVERKYGSISDARNTIVNYRVNWFEDTRILSRSQYSALQSYEKKYWTPEFDINNAPLSYVRKPIEFNLVSVDENGVVNLNVPSGEEPYWVAVTALEMEEEENAKKTNIRLLDSRLAPIAVENIKKLLSE